MTLFLLQPESFMVSLVSNYDTYETMGYDQYSHPDNIKHTHGLWSLHDVEIPVTKLHGFVWGCLI